MVIRMLFILATLWFIRETKAILFWLYLWQLKEYHIGRFLDHFGTEKGKKLLFNKLLILKIILISFFFLAIKNLLILPWLNYQVFIFLLFVLYFLELIKGIYDFFRGTLKAPIFTKKIIFLSLINFAFAIFYLFSLLPIKNFLPIYLLTFDIFTPVIASGIMLIFQPLTVLGRNQIIKKAKEKRAQFKDLLVIGITGSYGKTSTKEFLATILSEKFNVLKTLEHQNSEVGISQRILNDLKEEHEIFIVEMGAYNRGGIKLLCDITRPKIGVITGINEQHMATFGSQENIIKAKYELIESLPSDGIAFFNGKNKYCLELYQKTNLKKFLYGQGTKLLGEENILGAMAVAKELGMTEEEISQACQKIENKFPGIEIKKGINGLNIIDAAYSANPDGVISHLEYLKTLPGKKIIVLPCLIELGKASKEVHRRIGQKIAEVCDLAIITTKERFQEIREGAVEKGLKRENILFIENPKEIFEKIKVFCNQGDVVLLESRVPAELLRKLIINNQ
jgi:UDP-N-acetylmuramoyl-tripeptide--D-alanyl-D-alanine ligase